MNIPILQMRNQEMVSHLASTKSGVDQFYSTLNIPASGTEFSARSWLENASVVLLILWTRPVVTENRKEDTTQGLPWVMEMIRNPSQYFILFKKHF